jgi:hypothetical protein
MIEVGGRNGRTTDAYVVKAAHQADLGTKGYSTVNLVDTGNTRMIVSQGGGAMLLWSENFPGICKVARARWRQMTI